MYFRFLCFLLVFALSCTVALAESRTETISRLEDDIRNASDPLEKSRLHIFRARHYSRINEYSQALEDYNKALELNHQGWIHLERCGLLMAMEEYDLAIEDAEAVKQELPTLAGQARKYIKQAETELQKQHRAENPVTIVLDTRVDPFRKSRFDVMEEQGVFAARDRAIKTAQVSRSKKASKPEKKVSSVKKTRS